MVIDESTVDIQGTVVIDQLYRFGLVQKGNWVSVSRR